MYITKKQYEYYISLEKKLEHAITADGIRFICEAYHGDAEQIGKHFIEVLPKISPPPSAYED